MPVSVLDTPPRRPSCDSRHTTCLSDPHASPLIAELGAPSDTRTLDRFGSAPEEPQDKGANLYFRRPEAAIPGCADSGILGSERATAVIPASRGRKVAGETVTRSQERDSHPLRAGWPDGPGKCRAARQCNAYHDSGNLDQPGPIPIRHAAVTERGVCKGSAGGAEGTRPVAGTKKPRPAACAGRGPLCVSLRRLPLRVGRR